MSRTLWAALALFVTLLGLLAWSMKMPVVLPPSATLSTVDDNAVRTTVTSFGRALRNVSLLAPDVAAQIAAQYGPYAAPDLVAGWQANPEHAPGRQTSSPWPERIDIVSVTPAGGGYQVTGNVVEVTNGSNNTLEPAATYPVALMLEQQSDGRWVITSFSKGAYAPLP